MTDNNKVTIDGVDYDLKSLSEVAVSKISDIKFSDTQIVQLQNELAISSTARNGYLRALKAEIKKKPKT